MYTSCAIIVLLQHFFIFWIVKEAAAGCGKVMIFGEEIQGKALRNHVFSTNFATDDTLCKAQCFLDDRCISYNFGTSANGQKHMCELSQSDHILHPEDLVHRPDTIYISTQNSCNCSNDTICRFNFVDFTHRCDSYPGFTGIDYKTRWVPSRSGEVCIGSKSDRHATFACPRDGHAIAFKLIYTSGGGLSYTGRFRDRGYWGGTNKGPQSLQLHVTSDNSTNHRVAPPANTHLDMNRGIMAYSLPGVTNMDPVLVFPDFVPALQVKGGQKFRIWFGQDLSNKDDSNNVGKTCVRVEVLYS